MTVLHLLALLVIGGLIWAGLIALPLFIIGGVNRDDLRRLLLHYAYKSFTFEGDVIPGLRPALGTRLVIRALSHEDDARRALVTKAIAGAEPRRRPLGGTARLPIQMARASTMSQALQQARWFTSPVLSARTRDRCASAATGGAW